VFISLFLSPGGGTAELKTARNLIYTVINHPKLNKKKPPSNTQRREAIPKTDLSIYFLKTVFVKYLQSNRLCFFDVRCSLLVVGFRTLRPLNEQLTTNNLQRTTQ
jgi:hypothetical protein